MSAGTLVYLLMVGTLVATACWAVEGLCRGARLPARWPWAAGLVALVIAAVWAALYHEVAPASARGLDLPAASLAPAAEPVSRLSRALFALLGAGVQAMGDAMSAAARMLPSSLARHATAAWALATLGVLVAITLVHVRVAGARRRWPLAELHGQQVRIAPAIGPAVLGALRPFVVVPRWFLERSDDEQRLVLAHEGEHVRARDHLLLTGAWLAVALVPWHPAAWWMLSRLRLAIELDCDARVLRRGIAPRAYGTLLIDLAARCSGSTAGATALADSGSHLQRRLLAMKPIRSRHARLRVGALLSAGVLAVLAACEAKLPTSAEVEKMDVAGVEKSAAAAKVSGTTTTYYVDGVLTDEATAHAIAPNRIATVNVMKQGDGAAVVRIQTLATPRTASADGGKGPVTVTVTSTQKGDAVTATTDSVVVTGHGKVQIDSPNAGANPASMKHFTGIVIVDGVRVSESAMSRINPSDIVSVEVLKGPAARKLFDEPAADNGVIRVTTRAGAR